jgi:hypothetical protein
LSEQTRHAVDDYLKAANKKPGEFLFTGRRGAERSMTTRQYARLVSQWIAGGTSTVSYISIEVDDTLAVAEQLTWRRSTRR